MALLARRRARQRLAAPSAASRSFPTNDAAPSSPPIPAAPRSPRCRAAPPRRGGSVAPVAMGAFSRPGAPASEPGLRNVLWPRAAARCRRRRRENQPAPQNGSFCRAAGPFTELCTAVRPCRRCASGVAAASSRSLTAALPSRRPGGSRAARPAARHNSRSTRLQQDEGRQSCSSSARNPKRTGVKERGVAEERLLHKLGSNSVRQIKSARGRVPSDTGTPY